MADIVGITNESDICFNSSGKPFANGFPEFNISHSGDKRSRLTDAPHTVTRCTPLERSCTYLHPTSLCGVHRLLVSTVPFPGYEPLERLCSEGSFSFNYVYDIV